MSELSRITLKELSHLTKDELKKIVIDMLAEENDHVIENNLLQDLVRRNVALSNQLKETINEVERLSNTDQLTKLYNRYYFVKAFEREQKRCRRYGGIFSIIMFDIDHFKKVNDTFGHDIGDRTLIDTGRIAQEIFRDVDVLARWGGEEFIALLTDADLNRGLIVAERLRKAIELNKFFRVETLTISLGVSEIRRGDTMEDLIKRADEAMYEAKHTGRNRVCSKR